jgi:hypothetical protein
MYAWDTTVSEFDFACMHSRHSAVPESTDSFVHAGNTAMPECGGHCVSHTRDATVSQSGCTVSYNSGHAAVSIASRADVSSHVSGDR